MKDDCGLIVMFHSILKQTDKMRGGRVDKWYNDMDGFEKFCRWLMTRDDISVITNKELHLMLFGGER